MSDEPDALAIGFRGAARRLGVSEKHLRNHYQEYGVPHRKLGGRVLFPVDELRDWLRNGRPRSDVAA